MKYLFLLLCSFSAFSYSDNPNRKAVDAATLEIQVAADKSNGTFETEAFTDRKLELVTYEIPLVFTGGQSFLYKYLRNGADIPTAVKWSHAIAKHRYTVDDDDDKFDLYFALEEATIKDGHFVKTDSLLDCKTNKFIDESPKSDAKFGFYPRINIDKTNLWGFIKSREAGNLKLSEILNKAKARAKLLKYEVVHGVLFAYSREDKKIQSCKISI